jgi:GNAT superfamily N-acetyltransferase
MHAAVGRVVTTSWGQVFLRPEIGRCYEVNQGWAIGDAGGVDAATIVRDLDRLLGGVGLTHRQVSVEEPAATRLADALRGMGYGVTHHLYLAHAGPPPAASPIAVEQVDIGLLAAGYDHYLRTDPDAAGGEDLEVRGHIVEYHRTYGSAGTATERCFAVVRGGAALAWAKLWTDGPIAQVEDVICLAEHRGHGYGRAVVAAATRAALAEAPELLIIAADDDDWPKDLYGRLGYRPIGRKRLFARHDPGSVWRLRS